jgi:hypothetical protein
MSGGEEEGGGEGVATTRARHQASVPIVYSSVAARPAQRHLATATPCHVAASFFPNPLGRTPLSLAVHPSLLAVRPPCAADEPSLEPP